MSKLKHKTLKTRLYYEKYNRYANTKRYLFYGLITCLLLSSEIINNVVNAILYKDKAKVSTFY